VLILVPLGSWQAFRLAMVVVGGVAVGIEIVRLTQAGVQERLGQLVPVFRPKEARRPSGAMWLGLGYALAALTPPPAPAAGILVAALADPAASLVGTWRRSSDRKSWRGSFAHAAVAVGVLAVLGWSFPAVLAGAATATVLERLSFGVDDNLLVAPVTALAVLVVG
jgi:dolichol kinase